MNAAKFILSAAAASAVAGTASAQFPGLTPPTSAVPSPIPFAPPPPNPVGIAPYPGMPEGPTIWSKLGISQSQREYRRRQSCRTPAGQLMARLVNPLSTLTGGLIPPYCPTTPSLAELQDPGVVGAAAKVKQDKAAAAERVKAIQYLAGVDCTYWPEAEATLIAALREDRNECVRYNAAMVLGKGCCCTCKVIVALSHTVCCSIADNGVMEKSARVRSAAAAALEKCLASNCVAAELPTMTAPPVGGGTTVEPKIGMAPGKRDEVVVAAAKPGPDAAPKSAEPLSFKDYYALVPRVPKDQVVLNARRALETGRRIGYTITESADAAEDTNTTQQASGSLWESLVGPAAAPQHSQGVVTSVTRTVLSTTEMPAAAAKSAPAMKAATATTAPKLMFPGEPAAAAKPTPAPAPPAPFPVTTSKIKMTPTPAPAPAAMPTVKPAAFTAVAPTPAPVVKIPQQSVAPMPVSAPVMMPTPVAAPALVIVGPTSGVPAEPVPLNARPIAPIGVPNPYGFR